MHLQCFAQKYVDLGALSNNQVYYSLDLFNLNAYIAAAFAPRAWMWAGVGPPWPPGSLWGWGPRISIKYERQNSVSKFSWRSEDCRREYSGSAACAERIGICHLPTKISFDICSKQELTMRNRFFILPTPEKLI